MRRIIIAPFLIIALCASSCQKKSEPLSTPTPTITIGVILPLTGNMATFGEDMRRGISLAAQEIQEKRFHYEILFEDNQFDSKQTATALQKLIHVDKADVIVTAFSEPGLLVSPIAEQNKVLHFGISYDPRLAEGFYNFNHWINTTKQASTLVQYLSQLPEKKIGIIHLNGGGERAAVDAFKQQLANTPLKVVFEEMFDLGERNFLTLLTKAKKSSAQLFFISATQPEMDILAKQMRDLRMKQPIISLGDLAIAQNLTLYENSFYVDQRDPSPDFVRKFEERFQIPPQLLAPHGFDIIKLIGAAYEGTPAPSKPSTHEVATTLLSLQGLKGAWDESEVDENGIISCPVVLKQIKHGERIVLNSP